MSSRKESNKSESYAICNSRLWAKGYVLLRKVENFVHTLARWTNYSNLSPNVLVNVGVE